MRVKICRINRQDSTKCTFNDITMSGKGFLERIYIYFRDQILCCFSGSFLFFFLTFTVLVFSPSRPPFVCFFFNLTKYKCLCVLWCSGYLLLYVGCWKPFFFFVDFFCTWALHLTWPSTGEKLYEFVEENWICFFFFVYCVNPRLRQGENAISLTYTSNRFHGHIEEVVARKN